VERRNDGVMASSAPASVAEVLTSDLLKVVLLAAVESNSNLARVDTGCGKVPGLGVGCTLMALGCPVSSRIL
jgi:hypothetical protein